MPVKNDFSPRPKPSRPLMPKDYGIAGSKSGSGLISWELVSQKINSARNYWVCTTRPDGRPHAMPVWGVWLYETFLFSTSRSSRKGRNLTNQPYLVIHLESGDDVVILEGVAEEAKEPALLAEFAQAYEVKYEFRPEIANTENVTYAVRLQVAFAWLESDFSGGATRWQF
jgi:hypothetical protein